MSNQPSVPLDYEAGPNAPSGIPTHELEPAPLPAQPTTQGWTGKDKEKKGFDSSSAKDQMVVSAAADLDTLDADLVPTEDDMQTLRKVSAPLPWAGVAMCLIEFAERASYYGSSGPFNNFINNGLPEGGNGAGAVAKGAAGLNQSAGALGLGSVPASALVNMFTFLAYVVPIYGGIVADTKWGRFKTICVGTAVGAIAHVLLVIPAIPSVISKPKGSLGAFIVSILTLAWAAGFIKPCLGPLLCDQSPVKEPTLKTLKSGERVIVDPNVTIERYLLVFYWCINIGAFFALATSYSARLVGFWLAYLLPGILYMLMPIVLVMAYKKLYKAPPQGSVVLETMKVFRVLLSNGGWRKMWKGGDDFWNKAKPSYIEARDGHVDLDKVFWDDRFVDEIKQSIHACQVFLLIPFFSLADGGIGNSINSMSTAMVLNGAPNDLITNFNPLAIIATAPVLNYVVYPLIIRRRGRPLKPMTKMCIGFLGASIGCIFAAVVQWKIYQTSPCGWEASTCDDVSSVAIWWQIPIIMIPAASELFVNPVSYELAYTRSPARMKGLVYALALFNSAISAAISLALANVIQDPWLVWPWVALAVVAFCLAWVFPTYFRNLNEPQADFANTDRMEGKLQPRVLAGKEESS